MTRTAATVAHWPPLRSFYWDSLKIIDNHDYIDLDGKKKRGRMTDNRFLLEDPKHKALFGRMYKGP